MPDKAVDSIVRFSRLVSDARGAADVLERLAATLAEQVCPNGVCVFSIGADSKLRLVAWRGVGVGAKGLAVDVDEIESLVGEVTRTCGPDLAAVDRPLVAGGNLYGAVVLLAKDGATFEEKKLALAEGLLDLAAIALGTAEHVTQLERQFQELHEQQDMLARTEKLRALGQMAAGVSHDLKNILNPLSLHIQIVTRAIDRGKTDDARESALEMKQVLQRGLQTLERLRDFSRQSKESKTELVDLDRLVREAVALGKARATSTGGRLPRIVEELTSPPHVMAISGEILSALVNLVVNAIDAMAGQPREKGGTITLRSGVDGAGSWIEVADDGPGMPPEIAARVFEPFFTTKGQDGTGLGLAMVYATMERHGGRATVTTAPSEGTCFRLWLPAAGPTSGRFPVS